MDVFVRYSLLLLILIISRIFSSSHGFETFGFDFHHRFSHQVKGVLTVDDDDLPNKGTTQYYAVMAHRDRLIHTRRLDDQQQQQQLTFHGGNLTVQINSLGFLHYANVSVGTPSVSFLVALDTGSDLFWVPCDCTRCVKALSTTSGRRLELNIYSPNASSTSKNVPCNSSSCGYRGECSGISTCPYQVQYLSNGTSSNGVLVEDVLHLTTGGNRPKNVDAQITFGCGIVETGSFLDGAAPNGLFGLGIDKSSVPSILSTAGIAANSFSMCFGADGIGRINFGYKGNPDQDETPFSINQLRPTYNISVTQITVEANKSNIDLNAIFDSGTSFTYLNDPAYTILSESFNEYAQDERLPSDPAIPFEFCYSVGSSGSIMVPNITLTMKGGALYPVFDPIVVVSDESSSRYCLGIVKSSDVNIIGQNFMTGYNIVFDREKMVLGWKQSNCYDIRASNDVRVGVPPATAAEPPIPATAAQPRTVFQNSGTPTCFLSPFGLMVPLLLLTIFIFSYPLFD